MKKYRTTSVHIEKIGSILPSRENNEMFFSRLPEGTKKCLIYPTDDLYLFEDQFSALVTATGEKRFYVMQVEEIYQAYEEGNCLFEISNFDEYSRLYDEYENNIAEYSEKGCSEFNNYFCWTKSLLFSDSFDWVLEITECLNGGIGVLGGNAEKISRFMELYGRCQNDYYEFEKDHKERNLATVIDEISNILDM